ncbi:MULTISPECIES: hypothetical protein [Streptomyces]|uniref:Uncharacterized protein n=2 Tax=Streptomyces rimosus subsp. rimosus TaxID=132474 RepID=L8ENE9_STRR1|nr:MULTISPECIES: hypothetical protein [Streptomyces]MYT44404.1 hypothetical protein [Streptomyces sp. SID5471]KEF08188.1 hypothetical protein DF17_07820 [Streptomyces rimosus]KUJ42721.1 hypothetical protein ADK46_03915 [Streptomyces rimosus subsp. rimosus]QDA05516.1 hypothetical protein CTZ40_18905 [Streptomyces rimosus]QEV76799.1 hypothetical protein CP984_18895 [Streptomyces rimosus]
MIRIVTAARLAGLRADLDSADERVRQLLGTLDENWARYLRSVRELSEEHQAAEWDAQVAAEKAAELHQSNEQMRQAFTAALLVIARQQHHIGELEQHLAAARTAPSWLYLLRKYGEPHSLHPTAAAAKEHAATCGASRTGWTSSDLPAAEVAWRVEAVAVVPEQAAERVAGAA